MIDIDYTIYCMREGRIGVFAYSNHLGNANLIVENCIQYYEKMGVIGGMFGDEELNMKFGNYIIHGAKQKSFA
jgi:hypothetical protein